MTKGLPTPWIRHLKDQSKKEEFEAAVKASSTALSRLYDLVLEKEADIYNHETSVTTDFNDPSWAYKQAFRNGQKTSLKEICQLLEFIKGNN